MPSDLPNTVVILGTGGTIAGVAGNANDNLGYSAAQRSVADLLASVPQLASQPMECEQVAQLDSKDMDHATWQLLAQRAAHHLQRADVAGVVVTHGTDTLEETAWFLHRVLAPGKPLVLTGAMRPATSAAADGPQNLRDAVAVARHGPARGVLVVFAGSVHGAADVRKVHPYRTDAFGSGDAGPLARVEEGELRQHRAWPWGDGQGLGTGQTVALGTGQTVALGLGQTTAQGIGQTTALGLDRIAAPTAQWPRVHVLHSHAGASGEVLQALLDSGAQGVVIAGSGNGSVHRAMAPGLARAAAAGVPVWICTRCAFGVMLGSRAEASPGATLSPWQARIELMLSLMGDRVGMADTANSA